MLTHRITLGWASAAAGLSKTFELSAGAEHNIDEEIAAGIVDREVAFVLDVSQCKVLYLLSDQPITIETNSGAAPGNVFTLAANKPFVWVDGNPAMRDSAGNLVVDITSIFISNPGEAVATLRIRSLLDPTL